MPFRAKMNDHRLIGRRDLLRQGAAAAMLLSCGQAFAQPSTTKKFTKIPKPQDAFLELIMAPGQAQVMPSGQPTNVWKYTAFMGEGPPGTVQPMPNGSYLGPVLRFRRGQRVAITMRNQLPEATITHWHGLDVPDDDDGHPRFAVGTGEVYQYDFTVLNRAGTYWYHPHPDMTTGMQVNQGLAGMLIVEDEQTDRLALPRGVYDVPLVLQDRTVNSSNQFAYSMGGLAGFLGTTMVVNGKADYVHSCSTRAYRLRILNGSSTRIYKLAWSDGSDMILIGTDGGLLEAPVTKPYIMLAPGERVEVWADFRAKTVGSEVRLRSLPFNPYLGQGGALSHGSQYDVCRFRIDAQRSETLTLPASFGPVPFESVSEAINPNNPRQWHMDLSPPPRRWRLNGALFELEGVAPNERVPKGKVEIVEFFNPAGQVQMPHPIHLHGRQFRVLERTLLAPALANDYAAVNKGFTDEGLKDTVLVWPGERVRILVRWTDFPGLYNWHCHILEHEDMGMMRNFLVE